MRIFIFTTVFAPQIGGLERLTELLAREFTALGHEVRLATMAPGPTEGWPFEVVRSPSTLAFLRLLRWCDVHLQANISLWHLHPLLTRTPFAIHHGNVYGPPDGVDDRRERVKAALARRLPGIAASRYVADHVGCGTVIGNAYDDVQFRELVPRSQRDRDIVFLGRLVSTKGCDTLLEAIGQLRERGMEPSCTIVGDGPERGNLEQLGRQLGISGRVRFTGPLQGASLVTELNRHRIMVVPSSYAEPFGIVALEGLACGCMPVVSARGGLVDAIGPHGLTFANGNSADLAARLTQVLTDDALQEQLLAGRESHLGRHTARNVALHYLATFETLIGKSP